MKLIRSFCVIVAAATLPANAQSSGYLAPSEPRHVGLYEGLNYSWHEQIVDEDRSDIQARVVTRSLSIHPGDRWEVCSRPRFRGTCVVLDRSVPDMEAAGLKTRIRSLRLLPAA